MSAATKADLSGWFDHGVRDGAKWMVVVCDTFDHEDYPCYFLTAQEVQAKLARPGEMQRIMEVYDLTADKEEQMKERRCWRVPA